MDDHDQRRGPKAMMLLEAEKASGHQAEMTTEHLKMSSLVQVSIKTSGEQWCLESLQQH